MRADHGKAGFRALHSQKDRLILGILAILLTIVCVVVLRSKPLERAGGHTWSDGSTYLGMAGSLAATAISATSRKTWRGFGETCPRVRRVCS